ncbi:hypothetical protein [Cellulomonas pakistanensis]|uniref:Uncharacterized protein n=1 Tax=Cellulomonas pakistanensis TaxID=992287 RepID=A0A919PDU1_9CELL|nr:hypothetical protein [Cellulomonas pakistanensis]GIG37938.1 hypothetical protein Cpa01nite_33190 [Cellulomonas pakistanensis]
MLARRVACTGGGVRRSAAPAGAVPVAAAAGPARGAELARTGAAAGPVLLLGLGLLLVGVGTRAAHACPRRPAG